jgi:hemolysin activation/secretion protein
MLQIIPFKLDLSWDDYGRNYTGRQRLTALSGLDNVTGIGDKFWWNILSQV